MFKHFDPVSIARAWLSVAGLGMGATLALLFADWLAPVGARWCALAGGAGPQRRP